MGLGMEEKKLQCGDCGHLSMSVEAAQHHSKVSCHLNYFLSDEAMLDLYCCSCSYQFNSSTAVELHKKQSGHYKYEDLEAKRQREEAERLESLRAELVEHLRKERDKQLQLQTRLVVRQSQMRLCLYTIKQRLKFVDQVEQALNTLMTIVRNVAEKPDEEKFRRIRASVVEKRICYMDAGLKFLQLCKFEIVEGGAFLLLPRYEVELELLAIAESELKKALSKEDDE